MSTSQLGSVLWVKRGVFQGVELVYLNVKVVKRGMFKGVVDL